MGATSFAWYSRRVLLAVAAVLGIYFVLFPLAASYVFTHAARAYVPAPELGTAYGTWRSRRPTGCVSGVGMPSKGGSAVIAFPGRKGSQKRQDARASRLRRAALRPARRGRERRRSEHFGWAGTRDLKAAISFLQARPDVDDDRIGGVGLSVGGEMLLQAAAETDELKAVVSEGAGIRSVREALDLEGTQRLTAVR